MDDVPGVEGGMSTIRTDNKDEGEVDVFERVWPREVSVVLAGCLDDQKEVRVPRPDGKAVVRVCLVRPCSRSVAVPDGDGRIGDVVISELLRVAR